jgi:SAM-dependent methyltransferase
VVADDGGVAEIPRGKPALIDLRSEAEFLRGHFPGAVNFPWEQLPGRAHELAPKDAALGVAHSDPQRAHDAAEWLGRRGHHVEIVPLDPLQLNETGHGQVRLWQPNPFLVEAMERIGPPTRDRRALDVACGSGRDAAYLTLAGWNVLAVDILPDAIQRARDLAQRSGVKIATEQWDLEAAASLPPGQFDLVVVFRYLHRPLFGALREAVAAGGYIVYETFHGKTLETVRPPRNPSHLLETGELAEAFDGFEILIARDAVERDGRYVSSILARK